MKQMEEHIRRTAIYRYLAGEKPVDIYSNLGRSKQWFFKWLRRYETGDSYWYREQSRKPNHQPIRTPIDLEQTVINIRNRLDSTKYSQIGVVAIQWEMKKIGIKTLPAWTINRILKRNGLIHPREKYVPSCKSYPKIGMDCPGSVHQMDVVGPRYIRGDGRFYSHNAIDVISHYASLLPCRDKSDRSAAQALIKAWKIIGLPDYL